MFEIKYAIKNIKSDHPRLFRKGNPFFNKTKLQRLSMYDLKYLLIDYSIFSRNAIHLLLQARITLDQWKATAKELDRNIAEELNEKGVPHLHIMNDGYIQELNLGYVSDSLEQYLISKETSKALLKGFRPHKSQLIDTLNEIFNYNGEFFTAGAVLALEYIAYEEFHILKAIITAYKKKASIKDTPLTDLYIRIHLDVEINHYEKLLEAILKDASKPKRLGKFPNSKTNAMYEGFYRVSKELNEWWANWEYVLFGKIK